jgi:hypothetical protein
MAVSKKVLVSTVPWSIEQSKCRNARGPDLRFAYNDL